MLSSFALFAAGATRSTFEFGRIQSQVDWLAPLGVFAALCAFAWYMYRRDSVEFSTPWRYLLTSLRIAALVGLLVVYLQPQWRNERKLVQNSRVVIGVDTSLSMGLHDNDASPVPAEPSRAQKVVAAISESRLLEDLRKTHDVVVARFDQEAVQVATLPKHGIPPAEGEEAANSSDADKAASTTVPEKKIDWSEALAPRGVETRLGQTLRQLVNEQQSQPISGIVMITDGGQNAGLEPAAAVALAREAKIPVFAVGIGSDQQPVNVRISDFVAPARAFPGDSYTATGYLQAQGLAGRTVTVELLSREATSGGAATKDNAGKLEASQQVALGADGEVVPVKFELVPSEVGRKTLRLRVQPLPQDRFAGDDQQEVDIEIVDRKTRVLLFAGGPSREYQFLRNQLRRDKDVVVDVLLQMAREGVSQDANEILDEFPSTREKLFAYDCIVAFDPDWRELTAAQIDLLEKWVAEQAGGLIAIAGPIHTDTLAQDTALTKIRNLYPVQFHKRFSTLEDGRYGSKEPWPIEFTRDGLDAEFLWIADSAPASAASWSEFAGVFGFYGVKGPKPGATVYGRYSDPRAREGDQQPVYFAGQFFGGGRVFYLGSGEIWRLRSDDEAYFERFYTKLIRFVSQGRLLRGSSRGVLLVERDRYVLGNTVVVRAQLNNSQLEPLTEQNVTLQIYLPDSTQQSVVLAADPTRAGGYAGQFTVRKEGVYRLELAVPGGEEERLARRIQVKVPDLERENPQRNDALLSTIARDTSGVYYVGLEAAVGSGPDEGPLAAHLRDQSRTTIVVDAPNRLWDNQWMMFAVCGLLCTEWLVRRLLKLA